MACIYERIDNDMRQIRNTIIGMNFDKISVISSKLLDSLIVSLNDSHSLVQKIRYVPNIRKVSAKELQHELYIVSILLDDFYQLSLLTDTLYENLKRTLSMLLKHVYSLLAK